MIVHVDLVTSSDRGCCCHRIISYDMYFVLSAVDYFMHTGDATSLQSWATLIEKKFQTSLAFFEKPKVQGFCGSDSRIGADFDASLAKLAERARAER